MKGKDIIEKKKFLGKTVIICGGSKGIGKETAILITKAGGNLCLIARGKKNLDATANECIQNKINPDQTIEIIIADTSNYADLKPKLEKFVEDHGIPDYLLNVVGYATPKYILDYTIEEFEKNMRVNYIGQLTPTIILLPYFMKNKKGYIANVSSVSGYLGMIGYSSYTPTKFAIVGWSEAIRHELKPYNIKISILYPPDTQTPGFDEENKIKPPETAMLSETAKLYTADKIAEIFASGILKNKFHIHAGSSRWISVVKRIFPRLFYAIIDSDLKKARKKLKK